MPSRKDLFGASRNPVWTDWFCSASRPCAEPPLSSSCIITKRETIKDSGRLSGRNLPSSPRPEASTVETAQVECFAIIIGKPLERGHASSRTERDPGERAKPSVRNLIQEPGLRSGTFSETHAQRIVSFFGPCAPRTRMRSMSPVRLGPVMNEIMLGGSVPYRVLSNAKASGRSASN